MINLTEVLNAVICAVAFFASGVVYTHAMERKDKFVQRILLWAGAFAVMFGSLFLLPVERTVPLKIGFGILGLGFLILFLHSCWKISWSVAVYNSIWSYLLWQLLYENWWGIRSMEGISFFAIFSASWVHAAGIFSFGFLIMGLTIAKWMPEGRPKKIGPRQMVSALLIFFAFFIVAISLGDANNRPENWKVLYLMQLLLTVILYLQSELFKKSVMRQELEVMNLLWKKEQEQYQLSKENIALINQKCHDLKHQIRAVRDLSKEDSDKYLKEIEDSVQIYEAIVKTGNEVLDTILTEKSLYCKERGITVSCVADGSQMDFVNMVDLYAILGNAIDNAIEAVEKFKHEEKRQIDVLIYRQQGFLVMNIINPMKETLVYEEELPISTKGDKRYHGFGLRSIRYLVKKYDGVLTISEEDGCFSLKILMPIPTAT